MCCGACCWCQWLMCRLVAQFVCLCLYRLDEEVETSRWLIRGDHCEQIRRVHVSAGEYESLRELK